MPPEVWEYVKTFGPVGVVLVLEGIAGARGLWLFAWAHNAQIALLVRQVAELQQQIKDLRADHVIELAQVRADKDAQIKRESDRSDVAWNYLDDTLAATQQIAHSGVLLATGSAASGPSSPPPGPPARPSSTRRPRS